MAKRKKILWADDDIDLIMDCFFDILTYGGFEVVAAKNGDEVLKILESEHNNIKLVILDIVMPPGKGLIESEYDTNRGYNTGIVLGKIIREKYKDLKIVGTSVIRSKMEVEWFNEYGDGFYDKLNIINGDIVDNIEKLIVNKRKISTENKLA